MAEALKSPERQPVAQSTQTLSPVMSELESRIQDPTSFKYIHDVYNTSTEKEKQILIQLIENNATEIEICMGSPNEMKILFEKIISTSEATVAKSEATVAKSEATVAKSEATVAKSKATVAKSKATVTLSEEIQQAEILTKDEIKTIDKNSLLKERLEKANAQLNDTYALFGNQKLFEAQFAGDIKKWRETSTLLVKAKEQSDGVPLSDAERETRIQVSMITSNADVIEKELSGDKLKSFRALRGELNKSADDLNIERYQSLSKSPGVPSGTKDQITQLLGLPDKDTKIVRNGNTFRYKDQIVDISTHPPSRSTEQFGLRASQSGDNKKKLDDITNTHFDVQNSKKDRLKALTQEKNTITNGIDSEISILNAYIPDPTKSAPMLKIKTLDESSYERVLHIIRVEKTQALEGSAELPDLMNAEKKVMEMKEKYKSPDGLQKGQERLPEITTNIQIIEQQLTTDKLTYQASLSEFANNERSNLSVLNKSGFSVLGQEKLNFSVSFINDSRKGQTSLNPIDLGVPLNQKDENALIRIIQLQLGEAHKDLFVVDTTNNITKLAPGDGVQEKVKSALFTIKNISLETFRARMGGHDLTKPVEYKKTETSSDSGDKQKPDGNQEKPSQQE